MSEFALEKPLTEKDSKQESKEKSKGQCLELFNLSDREFEKLNQKIEKDNGLIRLFVHPEFADYAEYDAFKKDPEVSRRFMQIEKGFRRLINSSSSDKKPAIIILEAMKTSILPLGPYYDKYIKALEEDSDFFKNATKNYQPEKDIYIVPTRTHSPDPVLIYAKNEEEAWQEFIDILKKLGVKKINIGGAELDYSEDYVKDKLKQDKSININTLLAGCLGKTIHKLNDHFDLHVSALAIPKGRLNINKTVS